MKVLLVGDYCIDMFVEGSAARLSPEQPVPVFVPDNTTKESPGMAGNVLANLQSLGADLEIIQLFPHTPARKIRYVDAKTGHHFLRLDTPDTPASLTEAEFSLFYHLLEFDAVVISDYNKGYLNDRLLGFIGWLCEKDMRPWFLDTKRLIGPWANGCILKINQHELEANLAKDIRPWEHVSACIVTYGSEGMKLYDSKGMIAHEVNGPVVEVRDGAGCGDTVLAALVVAYLENGFDLKAAMTWADKAGRVAVSKRGVVAVRREEVL